MEPTIWGPHAWTFLHSITFQYPENPTDMEKQKYYTFFNSLKNTLPCPNCREHYAQNYEKIPIRLDTRNELIEWLIDIHNSVNTMIGKREYSYDEVYDIYNSLYQGNNMGSTKHFNNISIIVILLLMMIIGYYYYINYYLKKE